MAFLLAGFKYYINCLPKKYICVKYRMNLIYICVFHQESYINLLKLLIRSISVKANINKETTDILIITSPSFHHKIQKELESFDLPLHYYLSDLNTLMEAACSRLKIFQYDKIDKYQKILYLDTDVLINSDVNTLFDIEISSEKLYALEEGNIDHDFFGSQFFDFTKFNKTTSAFSSGVLYFMNSISMQKLFEDTNIHIAKHLSENKFVTACLEQPFLIYNSFVQEKYDNQFMKKYVEINPTIVSNKKIVYHFSGGPGDYSSKWDKMTMFWEKMEEKMEDFIIDKISKNQLSLVSKERLIHLYNQCSKYKNTSLSFVECGVAKGGCLAIMKYASGCKNKIFGFDSFAGMPTLVPADINAYNKSPPQKWVGVPLCNGIADVTNTFECLNLTMDNVTLVQGFFQDTLNVSNNLDGIGDIAVLRLDGDWYESTKICLEKLYDKVINGGIIIIDDYGHFIGAKKATDEFREKHNIISSLIQTDYTEFYWIKHSNHNYIIQIGSNTGNTDNDLLFNNIKPDLQYILIEPVPYLFNSLVENYKAYTNVTCLNIAISNKNGTLDLYAPSQDNNFLNLVSYAPQLASVNPNHIHTFVPECKVEKITVKCKTLNKLIEEFSIEHIDTLITDTEGHDYDILMDLNLSVKPRTIIFENKHMDGPKHSLDVQNAPNYYKLLNHFKSYGYSVVKETNEDTHIQYLKTVDIYEDIWTCSDKMRYEIADFFKDKSHYKIAEIGAHKGYSTKPLSYLFSKVYAVDNSVEYTNCNKAYNADRHNINYIQLDIYNDSWDILPDDLDVSFIDAGHNYESCKSDIVNSINRFKDLKYIIFDDYGVWEGVKQIIDEMIETNNLVFERFIGLTDVPGPSGIVKNTHEGIICSVNNTINLNTTVNHTVNLNTTNTVQHTIIEPIVSIKNTKNLQNNTYSWQNASITFLDNGEMDAFGKGSYTQDDTYTFKAYFGGRHHLIVFNNDYTEFTSTRQDDNEIVKGTLLPKL